jgi:hypothetical protein
MDSCEPRRRVRNKCNRVAVSAKAKHRRARRTVAVRAERAGSAARRLPSPGGCQSPSAASSGRPGGLRRSHPHRRLEQRMRVNLPSVVTRNCHPCYGAPFGVRANKWPYYVGFGPRVNRAIPAMAPLIQRRGRKEPLALLRMVSGVAEKHARMTSKNQVVARTPWPRMEATRQPANSRAYTESCSVGPSRGSIVPCTTTRNTSATSTQAVPFDWSLETGLRFVD